MTKQSPQSSTPSRSQAGPGGVGQLGSVVLQNTGRVGPAAPVPMTVVVTFTPLLGARTEQEACAHLLELDGTTLLLDCGWDLRFDPESISSLAEVAHRVDAVLLSRGDVAHLGSLAFARARLGLRAPVYTTLPVCKMGQMAMYDAHAAATAHVQREAFEAEHFSLDEVHAAFREVIELKYSQLVQLPGGITIAPHAAGHSIGCCLWRITFSAEEIVYCPVYNHQRERHLPPGALDRCQSAMT